MGASKPLILDSERYRAFFLGHPVGRELLLLRLRERRALIQGLLCSPLKSGGFFGTFGCTSKGYVGRENYLTLLEREGVLIQGSLCSPLKSGGFGGTFVCTGKGYVERELLSLRSREREVLIQGSLRSPLKSGGFGGTFVCTRLRVSKGLVGVCRKGTSLASLEREGYLIRF